MHERKQHISSQQHLQFICLDYESDYARFSISLKITHINIDVFHPEPNVKMYVDLALPSCEEEMAYA